MQGETDMTGHVGPKAVLFSILVAIALGTAGAAAPHGDSGGSGCGKSPACLEVAATQERVTASQPNTPAYANLTATVTGTSKKKGGEEVELTVSPLAADTAGGFVLFSATPSAGTCSLDSGSSTLTCSLGKLKRDQVATVDLVLETPQAVGDATLDFAVSPKPKGKSRPVSVTKVITITAPGGETATSFVPEGTPLTLEADKSGQAQTLSLPAQGFSTTAELAFNTTDEIPFTCPKWFVCRTGDWFSVTVPGTFDPPAEFRLFWPASVIDPKQTEDNFAVFYVKEAGAPLEIIKKRCDKYLSVIPCLKDVKKFWWGPSKGGFAATVVRIDNGKMH
jgi:hypothetical protein